MDRLERRRRELPDHRQEYINLRERWAELTSAALREAGLAARVDHRSLAAQGIDREPLPRIPLMQLKMEQRGLRSERAEQLRADYRERVQSRLERSAISAAAAPASPARAPGRTTGETHEKTPGPSPQSHDLEEIRRQAREEWRRLRPKEPDHEPESPRTTHQAEDDLAL